MKIGISDWPGPCLRTYLLISASGFPEGQGRVGGNFMSGVFTFSIAK